jgi:DNA-binding CsgD family transcriptional regulator
MSSDLGALAGTTSMVWPAMFRLDADGTASAAPELERARATVAQINSPWVYPFLGFVAAGAGWASGDWDGAVAEADAALEMAEETGTGWISIPVGERIDIDARRGLVRAARQRLDEFRSRRLPDQFGRGDVDVAELSILEAEGSLDGAAALAESYWTRVRTQPGLGGADFAIDVARLALVGLRPHLVEQVIADVERLPPAERTPGVLELIRGAARSDPAEIGCAHAMFVDRGFHVRAWHAQEELACALVAVGDRPGAVAAMEEAIAGYERMRSIVDRDRLLARMRLLGIRRGSRQAHRTQASGWDALTATERRITDLVCDGLTNREIAARLYISPRTVQSHVSHVLEKTGLRSRVEVAAAAPR